MTSWSRRLWASCITVGSWLYIDGGEIANGTTGSDSAQLNLATQTFSIDLSKPWTAANVTLDAIEKPAGCPSLDHQTLLFNSKDGAVYSYGGESSSQSPSLYIAEPLSVWKFVPDGKGKGSWSVHLTASDAPFQQGALRPLGALFASGDKEALLLGGFSNAATSPQTAKIEIGSGVPIPGMMKLDFNDKQLKNISASGYSEYSTAAWGGMRFIPSLGPHGVYVMIGGETPPPGQYQHGASLRRMDNITVYEPVTQRWFYQIATGDELPSPRIYFCIAGIGQKDGGSFEIFMYGGYDGTTRAPSPKYDELWVLSLPGFHYRKATYPATNSRHGHTCSVIGNRYMVSIGGGEMVRSNFSAEIRRADPVFVGGIGIFDLSKMTWVKEFDPNAAPYFRPKVFDEWYTFNGRYPKSWAQPELRDLLQNNKLPHSPSGSKGDTLVSSSSSNKGPIIGGAIGGVCGLLIIVVAIFLFRRQKRSEPRSDPQMAEVAEAERVPELGSNEVNNHGYRRELSTSLNAWELEGRPFLQRPVELPPS